MISGRGGSTNLASRSFPYGFALVLFSLPWEGVSRSFSNTCLSLFCFAIVALCNCCFAIVVLQFTVLHLSFRNCGFGIVVSHLCFTNCVFATVFCTCVLQRCVAIVVWFADVFCSCVLQSCFAHVSCDCVAVVCCNCVLQMCFALLFYSSVLQL